VTSQNNRDDVSHAVEDATGFNFRSLRTLWDLVVRPNRVFLSYATRDRNAYTPALRLWFGLIGLQVLVSAIWGGWEGLMRRQIENSDPAAAELYEQISGNRLDAFLGHYGDAMGVAHPILIGGFSALSVFLLGLFRKGLAWPSRLNIAMGVLVAGSIVGLVLMPVMSLPQFTQWMWAPPLIITAAYFITFLRGAPGVLADTTAGSWIKAVIYALVLILLVALGGIVLAMVATIYALYRLNAG
jgi:hypothetical protein